MNDTIDSLGELEIWARNFVDSLTPQDQATIVALSGDLGAGKTTLVQGIARALGVREPITSPTFVIQKEYQIKKEESSFTTLIHIDAYRLTGKQDLEYLGWNEIISNPRTLVVIEWPEMVEGIAMPKAVGIHISINPDQGRTLSIT